MHLLILLAELSAIFSFLQSHIHRDLSAKITIFLIMQTKRLCANPKVISLVHSIMMNGLNLKNGRPKTNSKLYNILTWPFVVWY